MNNGSIPIRDPFSFARPDTPWYAFEWLSQVAFSALNNWAGLKGVVFSSGVLLAVTFTVVLRHALWRSGSALLSIFLVLVAASAASLHFHARPHIFTMLLLAIAVWMLDRDRTMPSRWVWTLPVLTALWANLHGGFLLFVVLLGLLAIGSLLEGRRDLARRYALLCVFCSTATIVNPYGVRLPLHVIEVVRSRWMMAFVDEFKAPDFRSESHLAFMFLLFLSLAVLIPLMRRNRVTDALWIVFLAYCSLTAVRYVALFAIVCLPVIAAEWSAFLNEFRLGRQTLDAFAPAAGRAQHTSIWPAVFVAVLPMVGGIAWPIDFDPAAFPVSIASTAPKQVLASRLFTTDQWANYLIFKDPRQRVFIDSQHQMYGERILADALGMMLGRHDWKQLLDQYKINAVLCPRDAALASLLLRDSDWTQVSATAQASLYARKARP